MIRNAFRLTLLGAVVAVLLGPVPVVAQTGCGGPQAGHEVEPTPELATELWSPESVELQTIEPSPCLAKETYHVCDITDPCTGQIFLDSTCCPPGTHGACLIEGTPDRCITGVRAVCLGTV